MAFSVVARPVAGLVRLIATRLPRLPSINAAGESRSPLRFFSITPPGRPVTIAVTATMPSATPSKRIVDGPAGRTTVRVSLIMAKPFSDAEDSVVGKGLSARSGSR
ncbi:hypothetical protein [Sphingomonas colocasiae]|uniref:Uncharacterized protein n=1 Tax=Sphingomonas colocasiae TaxID=1848973 RepID=A0ABS7PJ20_9SPHN|nr:hypothetical protein [Sphingomonas colocasiae]MBY8820740.1 hypothetical protein [Sphingomonas colocasiae]